MGCTTPGSVMNREAGPESRAEVACAVAANGFTWEVMPAGTGAECLAALRAQMEASFRQWTAHIGHLHTCVVNPAESERARRELRKNSRAG